MARARIGYLYAIEGSEGVKIGCSIHPEKRVRQLMLSSGSSGRTYISRKVVDMFSYEKSLHNTFRESRLVGEWFDIDFQVAANAVTAICSSTTDDQIHIAEINQKDNDDRLSNAYKQSVDDLISLEKDTESNLNKFNKIMEGTIHLAEMTEDKSFIDKLSGVDSGNLIDLLSIRSAIQGEIISELTEALKYYSSKA
ncbi:hypothetical protein NVP1276O_58 [Vibrio phage 1.276.O._10N.286.54.E4]|nr:hypothetical protein NVP1276O_58 [Vibrio phage 1.276.O._10N.286.54.E4]